MWKGLATTELYEEFLKNGLCAEHSKEFILASTDGDIVELRTELQRKALLFIRLRVFDPIVFNRPCVSPKLMDLLSREDAAPKRDRENLDVFVEKFTLFDSVLVFIICYFSRICCIGALFLRKTKLEVNPNIPLIGILQNVLEKKHLLESEINVLYPLLQKNFNDFDPDQIRLAYVASLLFVRNYIKRKPLKVVTDQLVAELKTSAECQELNLMGNEAYKKELYENAIELYRSALSKNPYSYMILNNRAQAYKRLRKYREAQLDSYITVALYPTWCMGYYKLSSSLYLQKLYDQAFYVAEYGLAKCKNTQCKVYENLESLKLEASFKKSPTETIEKNTSESIPKKSTPDKTSSDKKELEKEDAQNCFTCDQKEFEKETEKSDQLKLEINSLTPKKSTEIQNVPTDEEVKQEQDLLLTEIINGIASERTESFNEKKKAVSPSEENLTQLSPQKDVPPLLEAPESDDSYSEAAPPLMEAPESDDSDSEAAPPLTEAPESDDNDSEEVPPLLEAPSESDDSYYEDEAEFESPPEKEVAEKSTLDCNTDQQEQKSNLEQNIEKLKPDTTAKASGVINQRQSQTEDKVCGTLDELLVTVEKKISSLTESLVSKVTQIEAAVSPCSESTSSVLEVNNTTPSSSENHKNPCETSDNIKTADNGTELEKPKDANSTTEETAVTTNIKDEKKPKNSKEEINSVIDVEDKSSKKIDKKLKTVQAQNVTSVKKKPNSPKAVTIDGDAENKIAKVRLLLKDGSEVLANGCGYLACRYFQEALSLIQESPHIYGFQECDIVCIKYAYAKAFYLSGEYSDLQKCIDILHEIRQEHENVSFPTVYYGLALAFLKLNRFKDSLSFSKKVEEFLNKGFRLKVYPWPGLIQPIPETKAEILKNYIKDLIEECENPPKPVAVCRYENCSQPHIYYSDPDFKGFICISCSEQCSLQYHITCWRNMKTDLSLSDKDFLNKNCLTPDCDGSVVEVKNIDKQGNIGKVFASSEIKKPQKIKKSKLEKKSDAKEEKKKKRRNSNRCDSISSASEAPSHEDLNPSSSSSKLSQNETESEVSSSAPIEDLENPEAVSNSSSLSEDGADAKTRKTSFTATEKNCDVSQKSPSAVSDLKIAKTVTANKPNTETEGCSTKASDKLLTPKSAFSVDVDPFSGVKEDTSPGNSKNAEIMITKSRPVSKFKGKSLKCNATETSNESNSYVPNEMNSYVPNERHSHVPNERHPPVPNDISRVQYGDAFWSTHEAEDFPPLPGSENSSHYAVACQNKDLSSPPDTYFDEVLEKNIFRYLEEFLSFHGPLKIDDPILIEALSEFPIEANVLIADSGGISEFLKKDLHFAVVGESYVCVVKDIGSAYNLVSRRSLAQETDCHDLLNSVCDFSSASAVKNTNFPTYLNPDAMEYKPFFSTGTKYGDHGQQNVSHKIGEHNSESLMSVISRLRQPLCVDEDNVVKNSSCDNVSKLDTQSFNSEISNTAPITTGPHLEKEVISSCDTENMIALPVDVIAEEEAVLNGTPEEKISDKAVEEGISGDFIKERIFKGSVKKIPPDGSGEGNISKENVLRPVFKVDAEEKISEGRVEEKTNEEILLVNNSKERMQERSHKEAPNIMNLKEKVHKKDLGEMTQRILKQDSSEGIVQEKISDEAVRAMRRISEKIAKETLSNVVIKDDSIKTALNVALNSVLMGVFLSASDEEMDIENEKVGNLCIEAMGNKTLCEAVKVSENSLQNQIVVNKNLNCGHIVPVTIAKASQTENAQQTTMLSKGTMTTDESLDRMKEIIGLLQDKERVSLEKYKLMEIKYKACLEEMHKRDANFKSRNECAEKELNACKVASEELREKMAENEKLRNKVESLQIALQKSKETNELFEREQKEIRVKLAELDKNLQQKKEKASKESERLQEELLKAEEKCKKIQGEYEERCNKMAEKLAETEKMYKKSNEKLQLLEKKEISLRTESQAAFEHLNELVASLTNEKLESIKRAVKAELNVLQLKKAEVLNKIDLKITEANQKVKELKEGISLIPLDPVNTKNIEALMSQIENQYVKNLCAIRDDYEAKIDKQIKEVESGTPLEKLKIDEVKNLPEIPQLIVPSPTFNPTTYPAASVSVDPSYVKMTSAFTPLAIPPTLKPIGTANAAANVPIVPIIPTNIAASVPEPAAAASAPTLKLPPGISSSFVGLPKSISSCSSVKEAAHEPYSLAQLSEVSKKENAKAKIISSDSLSSLSSAEGKAAAKFPDSSLELGYSLKGSSAAKVTSVPQGKNSYEKLLSRLVEKFPNYTKLQLTSFIKEFREKRQGKLSGLTLDAIVTQVGALIQSKQSAAINEASKAAEVNTKFRPVQNKVSGKKLITELKAREPPAEVPPVKKGNPWASSAGDGSRKWSGDTLEECAICCEEFPNEKAAYKVDCGHCFHLECIREWLKKKSDCPICRVHLLLPEDYPSLSSSY